MFAFLDDDLAVRLTANKLRINRPPQKYSRFKMMRHKPQKRNKKAASLLMKARGRFDQDGLNSVNYKVVNITLYTGFTHILVDVGEKERREVKKKKFQHLDSCNFLFRFNDEMINLFIN